MPFIVCFFLLMLPMQAVSQITVACRNEGLCFNPVTKQCDQCTNNSMVEMAADTTYASLEACYAQCSTECTAPNFCKCYFVDRIAKTQAVSKCSLCAVGSYTVDDQGACIQCGPGTFTNVSSWFPMQITYGNNIYTFIGIFSDGFPMYNNGGSYIWWWVYMWMEYWTNLGGNQGWFQAQPPEGGYYEHGQYIPVKHLVSVAKPVNYCMACPPGTFMDRSGASACVTCPAGTYMPNTGATACIPCFPYIPAIADPASCNSCPAGQYADPRDSQCHTCSPGTYQPTPPTIWGPYQASGGCGRTWTISSGGEMNQNAPLYKDASVGATLWLHGNQWINGWGYWGGGGGTCAWYVIGYNYNGEANSMKGLYDNSNSYVNCPFCPAGTFINSVGASACSPCPTGTYSNAGARECTSCGAGTYTSGAGFSVCTQCSAGSFNTAIGSGYPMELTYNGYCGSYYAFNGMCSVANPGYKCATDWKFMSIQSNNAWIVSTHSHCSPYNGWGGPGNGVAGLVTASTNVKYCSSCPAGSFNTVPGATTCQPCTKGTTSDLGGTSCYACKVGTYNTANGQVCSNCAEGNYTGSTGSTTCASCGVGTYAGTAGLSACALCNSGTFSDSTGASVCSGCAKGLFQSSTGQTTCLVCNGGQYLSATGNSACAYCSAGTFTHRTGSTTCYACPDGTGSYLGSSACVGCV